MQFYCGAEGNRTPDLLDANETRYQLCYSPLRCYERTIAGPEGVFSPPPLCPDSTSVPQRLQSL